MIGEPMRTDFLDFPTAWAIQNRGGLVHHERCSAPRSGGGFLCDCGAVRRRWEELCREQGVDPNPNADVAEELLTALQRLGDTYGPLGVAKAAARLTDVDVLVKLLTGQVRQGGEPSDV